LPQLGFHRARFIFAISARGESQPTAIFASSSDGNAFPYKSRVTVHGGTAVWLRRPPLHPVKPACVLGPTYSGPSDPPVLTMKPFTSRTCVRSALYVSTDNRQVQQVPSSPALRARSVLRAYWPPTCLRPEHLQSRFAFHSSSSRSPRAVCGEMALPFALGSGGK
jgi:hypothetical protein